LAALAALGTGGLAAPGEALAGLFGRKRQVVECPCPCPPVPTSEEPPRAARPFAATTPTVTITDPPHKTAPRPASGFRITVDVENLSFYGAVTLKCYVIAGGRMFPADPPTMSVNSVGQQTSGTIGGLSPTGTQYAEAHAEIYDPSNLSSYLDADVHLVKLT
jgi:hypothetical protein